MYIAIHRYVWRDIGTYRGTYFARGVLLLRRGPSKSSESKTLQLVPRTPCALPERAAFMQPGAQHRGFSHHGFRGARSKQVMTTHKATGTQACLGETQKPAEISGRNLNLLSAFS